MPAAPPCVPPRSLPTPFTHHSIDIPKELLDKCKGVSGPMTADKLVNHFNLVHYQLFRCVGCTDMRLGYIDNYPAVQERGLH